MPKILTEIDRLQKRQAILDAAAAEIARFGYDRANVNTIAERAGISIGTIYLYFKSKDDILSTLLDSVGKAIDDIVQECLAQEVSWSVRLQQLADGFVSLAESHIDYLRVQMSALHGVNRDLGTPMSEWLRITISRLTEALATASEQGVVAPLPPETVATLVFGTLESFVLLPDVLRQHDDLFRSAQTVARVLWLGIAPQRSA
jgi:TetR/AcrR family transcriptional regulator, fatty acid metabolism regulator protein